MTFSFKNSLEVQLKVQDMNETFVTYSDYESPFWTICFFFLMQENILVIHFSLLCLCSLSRSE